MYVAHHATAVATGARLVHGCGFDSIPHDLGAMFTVEHLPADVPITCAAWSAPAALPSGGTFETALTGMSRVRQIREAAQARRRVEPRPEGRSSRAVAGKPHRDEVLGYWLLPLPTMDPAIVARSGAALPSYGPRFRYSHYAGTKTLPYAVGGAAVMAGAGPGRPGQAAARPADEVVPGRRRARPRTRGNVVVQRRLRRRGGRRDRAHPGVRG